MIEHRPQPSGDTPYQVAEEAVPADVSSRYGGTKLDTEDMRGIIIQERLSEQNEEVPDKDDGKNDIDMTRLDHDETTDAKRDVACKEENGEADYEVPAEAGDAGDVKVKVE